MFKKKFYITTACPYVNAAPHIGHALEYVQTDVIARYHRLSGDDTYFLTGSDENSLKNIQAAEKIGTSTRELCDKNSQKFFQFKNALNISFDIFVRTTEKRHKNGAQALWLACKKEDIYKKSYKGLYCVGCEVFYNPNELVDGKCPEHLKKPEIVEEENYFFKLSNYQDRLEKLIATDELHITPQTRKNEVLSFIKRGLEDFSISRSVKRAHNWGIPVPNDPTQIIYVWFDALAYYITGLGYGNKDNVLFKKYWPVDLQVIGKGITRFHAVYWPAMLLSAGLSTPKAEFVHGYVTVDGQKISKSLGNVIDPFDLVKKYGIDPIRYYLLREIPSYGDGDFSESRFKELYNADLANGLGNLVSRVAKLAEKINSHNLASQDDVLRSYNSNENYGLALKEFRFNDALAFVWEKVTIANKTVDEAKPWELEGEALNKVLQKVVQQILEITVLLQPFLPETAEKILKQFTGPEIKTQTPLFPRIT